MEIKRFIGNTVVKTNIFSKLVYDSVVCEYLYIGLLDFMLNVKSLTDFNKIVPQNFRNDDKVVLNLFFEGEYEHK